MQYRYTHYRTHYKHLKFRPNACTQVETESDRIKKVLYRVEPILTNKDSV